jgi:uncharacterized protein YuzE
VADADYLGISVAQSETAKKIEPGNIADYDEGGQIVGIEVLSVGMSHRTIASHSHASH